MLAASRLLCLLVVAVLNAAASENDGLCTNITPQQGVTIDAMAGHWYVYRTVGPGGFSAKSSECADMTIQRLNETAFNTVIPGASLNIDLRLNDLQNPRAMFSRSGRVVMVAYLSSDGNTLVDVFCRPNEQAKGYMLFTKSTPISEEELAAIEGHLDAAGVIRTSDTEEFITWQNTATCTAPA